MSARWFLTGLVLGVSLGWCLPVWVEDAEAWWARHRAPWPPPDWDETRLA